MLYADSLYYSLIDNSLYNETSGIISSTIIDIISADVSYVISSELSAEAILSDAARISTDIVESISSYFETGISAEIQAVIDSDFLKWLLSDTLDLIMIDIMLMVNPDYRNTHLLWYISCLNGLPVSELTSITRMHETVPAGAMFMLSKAVKPISDDTGDDDNEETEQAEDTNANLNGLLWPRKDAKFMYMTLSSLLYDDMPKTEMMKHDTYEFAFSNHTHEEYDWFKVWPDYGPNGKKKDIEISAVLATYHFKNATEQNDVQLCMPMFKFETDSPFPRRLIGEFMFVAANTFEDVEKQVGNITDPNSDDFSGWIYPMGQTIYTKRFEFMEAKQLFGSPAAGLQFKVPNLAGFISPTTIDKDDDYGQKILEKLPGFNNVPIHKHESAAVANVQSSTEMSKTKYVTARTGRTVNCSKTLIDFPETDTYDKVKTGVDGNAGCIICAWYKEIYDKAAAANPPFVPSPRSAVPAGWRYATQEEKNDLYSLSYNDLHFLSNADLSTINFLVEGGEMSPFGIEYNSLDEEHTMSWPEHTFIPVLLYIGFKNNHKYKYFE